MTFSKECEKGGVSRHVSLYHVRLGGELVSLQAFQSHPLHGQLHSALVVDAVIFFVIYVSGQAEVRHLHSVALIQPVGGE